MLLDRDLQVMPGNALVVGDGGKYPIGELAGVPEVDPIDPRTLAIQRRLVVGAGACPLLDFLWHTPDFDISLGQSPEILRQLRAYTLYAPVEATQ